MFTENGGSSYHIGRMAVLKEYRKTGLGSDIMNALCKKAKELGAEKCELSAQCVQKAFTKLWDSPPMEIRIWMKAARTSIWKRNYSQTADQE